MSGNDNQRSLHRSLSGMIFILIALGLIAAALLRWHSNGWGALVWLAAMIIMFVVRTPHALRNRANRIADSRADPVERLLLGAMFMAMMILPLLHLTTGLFAFADYQLPAWSTWIGAIVQPPLLWLFWRSHADLGRNWSPGLEIRENHGLIVGGFYARIRHPMYAAIWLSALAQPLLVQNWIGGFLIIPAFTAMWFIRIPREEAMMHDQFGASYERYCATVPRLVPGSGRAG